MGHLLPQRTTCFFSYKGGPGRTALLARTAIELKKRNFRVCCVDFDIEAPGFEGYFQDGLADSSILKAFLDQDFEPLRREAQSDLSAISTKSGEIDPELIKDFYPLL